MKLTFLKRFLVEDFPSQQAWIGELLNPLNQAFEQLSQAMNKSLTIADNLDAETQEITFTGSDTVTFKVLTKNRPKGVIVSNFVTVSGAAPTAAVQPVWSYNSTEQTVTINSWFGGLSSTAKYRVTLFVHTI